MSVRYPLVVSTWDDEEIGALHEVIDSGVFTMGERTRAFERSAADYFGANHAVMVNSGSSANLLAVAALRYHSRWRVGPGAEVIVPAVGWSTTYFPLYQYGLTPVFVDVDHESMTIDVDQARRAVSEATRAIMPVNLLGSAADYEPILELCEERDLVLVEDNCEAMGAKYGPRFTGTIGACGTFSMFFAHHISTMEGGLVTTDDDEMYDILVSLRAHGWTRDLRTDNAIAAKGDDPFMESFRFVLPGYNLRPTELNAAVGLVQLRKLDGFLDTRRRNAAVFKELMSDLDFVRVQRPLGNSSWFAFAIVLQGALKGRRDEVVARLSRAGVEARPVVTGNFLRNPVMKHIHHRSVGELLEADDLHWNGFYVGNHPVPLEDELVRLREILDDVRPRSGVLPAS